MTGLVAAAAALVLAATSSAVVAATTSPTVPPSEVRGDVGDVGVVGTNGASMSSGDGATAFVVRLPPDASCPGDSANDQWRLHSFLLPIGDDPLAVEFDSTGPEPAWTANRWPLFAADTNLPISSVMLQRNDAPGSPGLVGGTPLTTFRVQAENALPGGRYRMGMACTYFDQTTQYWDTVIDIEAGSAEPSSLTWSLPEPVTIEASGSDSSSLLRLALVALAVSSVAYVLHRRRVDRAASRSHLKESP